MSQNHQRWIPLARNYLVYQRNIGMTEILMPRKSRDIETLEEIREDLGECTRCPLHRDRLNIVFGEGNRSARLMFVGEGPGADEDREGRPFVGRAGQLLTKMIQAMNLDRSEVYISNIVKSRPPGNRNPAALEIGACFPFLERQIAAIQPEVIVALGKIAANTLLETGEPIGKLRGKFHDRQGIPVMPTYHPSFLLREDSSKRYKAEAWSDLKKVMGLLGL
jgi:uracil-DNA glycosylase family 4